jgi:hypothetical protein
MLSTRKYKKSVPLCYVKNGPKAGTIVYYNDEQPTDMVDKVRISRDGDFALIPNQKTRQTIGVFGPSGVGKSTWIHDYCVSFNKFIKCPITLFSHLDSDETLDKIKGIERIKLNEDLVNEPLDMEGDFYDSLVIFDDAISGLNKNVDAELTKFKNQVLQLGRHPNIYYIESVHQGLGGPKTKLLLSETTGIVLFPIGGDFHVMRTLLTKYCGINAKEAEKIISSGNRWVYINKSFPRFVLSSDRIYLL